MQTVDEEPLETIHLYVVREEAARPSILPVFLAVLTLLVLLVLCTMSPSAAPEEHKTIRIPAVFLPVQSFTASVPIIPTGTKTYLATNAHGILTLTNGSVVSSVLPQGLIFTTSGGIEVVTLSSVFVPAGSAAGYGFATVEAKAVVSGTAGNIPVLSINAVYGTSLYIRNLQAFKGGENSYFVKVVTVQDRQTAIDAARAVLTTQQAKIQGLLAYPCNETTAEKNGVLTISQGCQFVTYTVASYMKVTAIRLVGKTLFVDVVFAARPRIIEFK
jgi:hypothetical protein